MELYQWTVYSTIVVIANSHNYLSTGQIYNPLFFIRVRKNYPTIVWNEIEARTASVNARVLTESRYWSMRPWQMSGLTRSAAKMEHANALIFFNSRRVNCVIATLAERNSVKHVLHVSFVVTPVSVVLRICNNKPKEQLYAWLKEKLSQDTPRV